VTLPRGLYETLLAEALGARIEQLGAGYLPLLAALPDAHAADRLAMHVAQVVESAASVLPEGHRAQRGVLGLAEAGNDTSREVLRDEQPAPTAQMLAAVRALTSGGEPETLKTSLIPLLDTTLLTNASGEASVGRQIVEEIESTDRVDIVMAFIRRSGIRPPLDALCRFTASGRARLVVGRERLPARNVCPAPRPGAAAAPEGCVQQRIPEVANRGWRLRHHAGRRDRARARPDADVRRPNDLRCRRDRPRGRTCKST
jgi:hypothetical protein